MNEELDRRRSEVDEFRRRWYRFVRRWRATTRRDPDAAQSMVERAMSAGLPAGPDDEVPAPPGQAQQAAERAVIAASDLFDADGYAIEHAIGLDADPARHFVEEGWRDLRAPSLGFDLWRYWTDHLDPTDDAVDPLLHYELVGRHRGYLPVAPLEARRADAAVTAAPQPRRLCLFAGYDRDGLVDEYVVAYLRELSRFADVYYLADGVLDPGELDKLADVTVGAWSIPHRGYDFGSMALLARELVGWDAVSTYDEVILANDSCFLLRPLDEVFEEMDDRPCAWWSLQATSMELDNLRIHDHDLVPLDVAKRRFLGQRHWSDVGFLHLSSYFMVFRRPVIEDPGFRWRLDTVVPQTNKMLVVHKYEVGLSRYLIDSGFDFDTLITDLYPFHPLYGRRFFELVERGFPLIKRNFVTENPQRVGRLDEWRERLKELVPQAPIDLIDANIDRVADPSRLAEVHAVEVDAETGMSFRGQAPADGYLLRRLDHQTPSYPHWWAFVCSVDGRLDPGARAVFERVRHDPSIHKVVLARGRRLDDDLRGDNVDVRSLDSVRGREDLVRCGAILLDAPLAAALPLPLALGRHNLVHTGAGLLVGNGFRVSAGGEWSAFDGIAVASQGEALLRAATTAEVGLDRLWLTGYPRHDLLVAGEDLLPADLLEAERRLRARIGDRRLVIFWSSGSPAPYPPEEVQRIGEWATSNEVVIAVREPVVDRASGWTRAFAALDPLCLSPRSAWSPVPVLRTASAVVTDGASGALDALALGLPLVRLGAADPEHRESVLDLEWSAPSYAQTADDLHERLADGLGSAREPVVLGPGVVPLDGLASQRLVSRLRSLVR